jgi:predicted ester cyclase
METRARREEIVLAHMDAEDRHAIDETVATFARPRYEVIPTGEVFDGAAALTAFHVETDRAFPDFHFGEPTIYHGDDVVIVEVDFIGTHLGPWRGLPATGRPVRYRMCNIFEFEGTDLVCERLHFDRLAILIQLGIARNPTTLSGRLTTFFNHPLRVGGAALSSLFGRTSP